MAVISKDLGPVSAYAVAVANGFSGTEAEWEQYIANASTAAQSAAGSATAADNSASAAAQSATAAAASQVAAAGSETEAANYALVAGNHAMAAAASATAAETAETGAESAQTAAEAAQAAAEAVAESIPEDYTELTEEVSGLKSALGDPFVEMDQLDISIVNGKKFKNTAVGNAMVFQDNTTYNYVLLSVEPGEKYKVTTYFYSADTYYIYLCDSNGIITKRDKNASNVSGSQTFDVEIPAGSAQLYIQGYSSAATIAGRMSVKKYVYPTFREKIDGAYSEIDALEAENNNWNLLKFGTQDVIDYEVVAEQMKVSGPTESNTAYVRTRTVAIYGPTVIHLVLEGWAFAVNQYYNYNRSSSVLIKNWRGYTSADDLLVYASAYPAYIMVGAKKSDGSALSADDRADFADALKLKSVYESVPFASIAMFDKFAVTGCSWDAGSAYDTSDGHITHTRIGWAEVLGRRNGCSVGNFAIGGSNIRSWFNTSTGTNSFKALLEADAYPLYILTEGNSNDANAFVVNDASYSAETPSTTTYYVGTIEDISTREDYHDYPCTFFGYYGRVIEMIKEHAPNTRIIISSPDTTEITTDIRKALRTACKAIATYYELPYMDIETDPYYDIYVNALNSGHPNAPTYSGWAMAIERLFGKTVEQYRPYFDKWSGIAITGVTVEWEPVELDE